ncbi:AbiU2 domain-containing protein [Alkalihalobacillus deserti]|uniref:AbiU2 domain-containing protein n=1 Tax=Alkalihalobacillus deserti TaxID=2879466 RepID=UPI001D143DD7|nr:hypothetical protein [Alkalihalobacillus deserti]
MSYSTTDHFEKLKEGLFQEIISINSFLELYIHIRKKRNDRLEILNKAPAFFQLTQESLLTSVIIGLAKIYEKRNKKGRTIFNFLDFIEANYKGIFSNNLELMKKQSRDYEITNELISEHKLLLEKQEPILNNLFAWRDKSFAHMDKKYFDDRGLLGEDYPITIEQIRHLIELLTDILNKYGGAYNGNIQIVKATNVTDIDRILNWLHKVEPYKIEINKLIREREETLES